MTQRGQALETVSPIEGGHHLNGNVIVDLSEMQRFQQSEVPQSNTAAQHLKPLQVVDELAQQPVCEAGICVGYFRHVDVFSTANFGQDQFNLLDKDGNKFITEEEIGAYRERFKENMTPRMAEHLDNLSKSYRAILSLSNDESGYERKGITMSDLYTLEEREDGAAASEHIKEFVVKHFTEVDADKNGIMTGAELKNWEAANKFNIEHPVRDRTAMEVLGYFTQAHDSITAIGDYLGISDPNSATRGLTRAQALETAEKVKNGINKQIDNFFFFDK